jgi:hypothetical protein
MPIYRMDENSFIPVSETTFAAAGLKERDDIQRRLRENIAIIAPDVMVISDEYSNWTDSDRRIVRRQHP